MPKPKPQPNPTAMISLGVMYEHGRGVRKDLAEAIKWYRKAASAGEPSGIKRYQQVIKAHLASEGVDVQSALRVAVETVRKWHVTVRHDLCLLHCNIPIHIEFGGAGWAGLGSAQRVTIYIIPGCCEREYLFTLAHEFRHSWQGIYKIAPTEQDCNDYAAGFLDRFWGKQPLAEDLAPEIKSLVYLPG